MAESYHTFRYKGIHEGWYALVAPTWKTVNRGALQELALRNRVLHWLLHALDDNRNWKIGNGAASGFEELSIAGKSGFRFAVLLRNKRDLAAFIDEFPTHGFNQDFLQELRKFRVVVTQTVEVEASDAEAALAIIAKQYDTAEIHLADTSG